MFFVTFILSILTWALLSGLFDWFHLSLGVIASLIVARQSHAALFQRKMSIPARLASSLRFSRYTMWLLWEIMLANLHVLYLALHPRMKELINPRVLTFETTLKTEFAQFVFANSITLTPGTVTISVHEGGIFTVHAISEKAASGLPDNMERRIARVFEPGS